MFALQELVELPFPLYSSAYYDCRVKSLLCHVCQPEMSLPMLSHSPRVSSNLGGQSEGTAAGITSVPWLLSLLVRE